MKKIFTLLTGTFLSLSLLAFDGSRLSISTVQNSRQLVVEVNGRQILLRNNAITIRDLGQGRHTLKIYRELVRGNGRDNGRGNSFGRREILYNGMIILRDGYHTDITINRFGRVFTDERRMDRNDDWYFDDDDGYYDGGFGNGPAAISKREFDQVKESLRKEWFDNNRLTSARFIIDNNFFTTQQVKELMQLFSFDDRRLELAKYAYRKTVDRPNYYQVSELLTFSNSKEELARFIRDFRQ
jgi:hypothetical protein